VQCTACSPGYGCEGAPSVAVDTPCPAGKFSTGGVPCADCCAGHACGIMSRSATQVACAPGQWSVAGSGTCSPCRAGYACPALSVTATPAGGICPAGKYSEATSSVCNPCPAGFACERPGSAYADIVRCVALPGHECGGPGATNASGTPCKPGSVSVGGISAVCMLCPSGYACPFNGTSPALMMMCVEGTSSPPGSASCQPCAPGRYASATASESCEPCWKGSFCNGTGTEMPADCPFGFLCPEGSMYVVVE
jgi:hypothetical protein